MDAFSSPFRKFPHRSTSLSIMIPSFDEEDLQDSCPFQQLSSKTSRESMISPRSILSHPCSLSRTHSSMSDLSTLSSDSSCSSYGSTFSCKQARFNSTSSPLSICPRSSSGPAIPGYSLQFHHLSQSEHVEEKRSSSATGMLSWNMNRWNLESPPPPTPRKRKEKKRSLFCRGRNTSPHESSFLLKEDIDSGDLMIVENSSRLGSRSQSATNDSSPPGCPSPVLNMRALSYPASPSFASAGKNLTRHVSDPGVLLTPLIQAEHISKSACLTTGAMNLFSTPQGPMYMSQHTCGQQSSNDWGVSVEADVGDIKKFSLLNLTEIEKASEKRKSNENILQNYVRHGSKKGPFSSSTSAFTNM